MVEPLGYTPPCLLCRTSDDDSPHFERRWKSVLKRDSDGYFELFQPEMPNPFGWVHESCLYEFMLHNSGWNAEGKARPNKVCIICEINIPSEDLLPLVWEGQKVPPVFWAHRDCLKDYQW